MIPTWVRGNAREIALPLEVVIDTPHGRRREAYIPQGEVKVYLVGYRRYSFVPAIADNVLHFTVGGDVAVGVYGVEVVEKGVPLRSFKRIQVRVVESNDELPEEWGAGDGEFDTTGVTLDASVFYFAKGDKGDPPDMSDYYTKQQVNALVSPMLVGVSSSGSGWVADKSAAEIAAAVTAGREVEVVCDGLRYRYVANLGAGHMFQGFDNDLGLVTWLIGDSVARAVTEVQEALVSGTTIKTINNTSLLGSGNMSLAPRPFIVSITDNGDNTYTTDKTFAEILAAYIGGAAVYFSIDSLTSQAYLSPGEMFIAAFHYGNVLAEVMLSEGGVGVSYYTLLTEGSLKTINNESLEGSGNLSLATQDALSNFCPIIEENSPIRVDHMTADAPFATLLDGQRIIFKAKWMSVSGCTLNLTLSDGNVTGDISIRKRIAGYLDGTSIDAGEFRPDGLYELIYSGNTWWLLGFGDTNNIYQAMTQAEVDAGTGTTPRSITPKMLCDNFAKVTTLVEVSSTGDVTQALDSGKFYRFGELDNLTLTLNAPQAGMGSYGGKFTASANWSALGLPAAVDEAAGNDTVASGKTYEFNVLDNIIVIKEV